MHTLFTDNKNKADEIKQTQLTSKVLERKVGHTPTTYNLRLVYHLHFRQKSFDVYKVHRNLCKRQPLPPRYTYHNLDIHYPSYWLTFPGSQL